jgi:hypothetical protein
MEKLMKRSAAAAVAAAAIVLSTLLGVRLSVGRETKKVERMFFTGVAVGTYIEPGIATHLQVRDNASNGLVSMAGSREELTAASDSLRAARRELADAQTIPQKAKANRNLESAYRKFVSLVKTLRLDEREQEMLEKYSSQMDNAQHKIDTSFYNIKVDELREELSWFPFNFLSRLVFAPYPQYFE